MAESSPESSPGSPGAGDGVALPDQDPGFNWWQEQAPESGALSSRILSSAGGNIRVKVQQVKVNQVKKKQPCLFLGTASSNSGLPDMVLLGTKMIVGLLAMALVPILNKILLGTRMMKDPICHLVTIVPWMPATPCASSR